MRYHARDMAVVRARETKIPIVLASATPSVESEVNARRGRYAHLHLPERFGGQHLPSVEAIDLRREGPPRGRFISPRLAEAVKIALERREQALLFLNRRGFAPLTLCNACGHRMACPNCDAWLVDHRFKRRLVCHHCGYSMPPPEQCPKCEAKGSFVAVGPGVERLEQEAAELFPGARILVLSSDLVDTDGAAAPGARRRGAGPLRHRHRHAARRQGPPFPQAQSGRHRRCRSRACQRRSARRRAHVPAAASGGRPRRPRGGPRLRLSADAPARASGDARADRAGSRGVLRGRDRGAREDRLSAVRPAGEPADFRRRQARHRSLCAENRRGRADPRPGARARSRRGAARGGARPLSLPPAGEIAAQFRPLGLFARMARRRAKAKGTLKLEVDVDPQSFF